MTAVRYVKVHFEGGINIEEGDEGPSWDARPAWLSVREAEGRLQVCASNQPAIGPPAIL